MSRVRVQPEAAHYVLGKKELFCVVALHCLVSKTDRYMIFKASQPRGRASGSRAYGRHEMQGVIIKYTRHE